MLAIADPSGPVALAGVVGGVGTGVTEATTSVLLESANFDPSNTHRTRRAMGHGTEASHRFERGIRAELAPRALRRAIGLILGVAGGTAAGGIVDAYPGRSEAPEMRLTGMRLRKVLGVDLPMDQVKGVLESLGFQVRDGERDELAVDCPLLALGHQDRGRCDRGGRAYRRVRRHTHDGDGDPDSPSQPQAVRGAEGACPGRHWRPLACRRS